MFKIKSAALTHPGRKRKHNEDFVTYFEPGNLEDLQASGCLYIVADGVGGAAQGERASEYAAERVLYEYYQDTEQSPGERLKRAMRQAGREIFEYTERSEYYRRMATTLVAAAIYNGKLSIANVGDSRAYLIRSGEVHQITRDHTTIGEMIRDGSLSEVAARKSGAKNRLTRSLGGELDPVVDVFPDIPLKPGDTILLCSDGLTRYVTKEELVRHVLKEMPEETVKKLVAIANQRGGIDNVSVIQITVGQPENAETFLVSEPGGPVPSMVDWETVDTQPLLIESLQKPYPTRLRKYYYDLRPYILLLMFLVLALCAASLVGLWIGYY